MKFLIYTVLTDENSINTQRFLNETRLLNLPVDICIYDCRKNKFDSIWKLLKKSRKSGNANFHKCLNAIEAHQMAVNRAKAEIYGATAFIDFSIKRIDEVQLTTLLVRSMDLGAVVPLTVSDKGVGAFITLTTKTDFVNVFCNESDIEEKIAYPTSIFAYANRIANQCQFKDHSYGENHELYRMFVKNNVCFQAMPSLIFEED